MLLLIAAAGLLGAACSSLRETETVQAELAPQPAVDLSGFQRATGPIPLSFPADHGPHLGYQTEWWYFTGNLETAGGRRFGYQLTFFRRALSAGQTRRESAWASEQVYMAHFALSDIGGKQFTAQERLSRGAAGLAGAQAEPFTVWLEDWRVEKTAGLPDTAFDTYTLHAALPLDDGPGAVLSVELSLQDLKGPILQGDQGYSRKGSDPGQASYYYSFTRLQSQGTIKIGEQIYPVSGFSWMDHEFSTSALSAGQTGWDWFALQLDDGSELMVFQIRRQDGVGQDGGIDPYSSGAWIAPDGTILRLEKDDFSIAALDAWKSPHSGAEYPSGWRVSVPDAGLELEIRPYQKDQELNLSYSYWEGAVQVSGIRSSQPVGGSGYVELTGYSGSMGGEF